MGVLQLVKTLWKYRDSIIIVLTPILLTSLLVLHPGKEARCGYVILLMAVYWMTEAVPLPVTAIIPVFAFPLLGVLSTNDVCVVYMKETTIMFLGGITVAIAVECCNLHTRIALKVLLVVGQSLRRLMAGFMLTTTFLSMWMSNTATTVVMIPIVEGILSALFAKHPGMTDGRSNGKESKSISPNYQHQIELVPTNGSQHSQRRGYNNAAFTSEPEGPEVEVPGPEHDGEAGVKGEPDDSSVRKALLMTVMYSANLGGTGVLTGTGTNLVFKSMLQSSYSEPTGLNFLSWMMFNVPGMVICAFLAWVWLQIRFLGLFCCKKKKMIETSPERKAAVRKVVEEKYQALGPIRFQEKGVLVLFIILVFLWLFRAPEFIPGWAQYFDDTYGVKVNSATPAMLLLFLFFCLPTKLNFWCFRKPGDFLFSEAVYVTTHLGDISSHILGRCHRVSSERSYLTWEVVQRKVPWGLVLLLGGGFAMAEAAKVSGLSKMLGEQLQVFIYVNPSVIVLVVCFMTTLVTEVASNTATTSILLPVLNELALRMKVNPLYLMLPATVCSSYAFMLPVGNPPNTIIFGVANMKTREMMKTGIVMNIMCVIVVNLMINTLGMAMFDFSTMPAWTNSSIAT